MYIKIQRQSPVLQDITCKLKQQVKLMGNHMVMFFQGWGNDIDSLICESGSKVIDSVLIVCKLTGEMALAVDMDMLCLEQMNCEEYDKNEVCHFLLLFRLNMTHNDNIAEILLKLELRTNQSINQSSSLICSYHQFPIVHFCRKEILVWLFVGNYISTGLWSN